MSASTTPPPPVTSTIGAMTAPSPNTRRRKRRCLITRRRHGGWRLLYESYGDAAKAKASFARYQQLDPSPNAKIQADTHLSSMDARRALYDAGVSEAQEILTELLLHSMGISTPGDKA